MAHVTIKLTQGNINNDHLYLSKVIDFFPHSAIGGANSNDLATKSLEIHCGVCEPVLTDIAGDKKIFRKRSWVKEFFKAHRLKAGDSVVIEHTEGSRYHVYPSRA